MKILAVEDNAADIEILRELLADQPGSSFSLECVRTLAEAGKFLARGDTDFVLLDLGLPDSQGIETLRAVRDRFPYLPIVVLTGFNDDEIGMLSLHEGAQDYLVKGQINGPSLIRSIRYADERNRIEQEIVRKNTDLDAMNDELTVTNEELHALNEEIFSTKEALKQKVIDLTVREEHLKKNEEELRVALAEKEVLLSEIHHRVKNNLAAFVSLLSLEGSTDDSLAGKMLMKDLQNRARSMALIHEILYRTNMYDKVDMEKYLTTLLNQVSNSYTTNTPVAMCIEAKGITLDIPRATPSGLIVNELVTNTFKYAFPASFDVQAIRHALPVITLRLVKDCGNYIMTYKDNGIGLPPDIDITKTRSLGLKLVNFLAKYQIQADVEVDCTTGTEFIFRFKE